MAGSIFEEMYSSSNNSADYASFYFEHLIGILRKIDSRSIHAVEDVMFNAYLEDKQFFFLGNGGSFATASHCNNDFSKGTRVEGKRMMRVIPLTDPSSLTAYSNDDGYENSFVNQLKALLNEGDIVVGITASGNSPNIIEAIEYANKKGARTIAWVGFDGGKLAKIAKHTIMVSTAKGEYGPVEDAHMILDHLLVSYLREKIADKGPSI